MARRAPRGRSTPGARRRRRPHPRLRDEQPAPDAIGRGVGTALYRTLFDHLARERVHRAVAGIALPNPGSVALHERFGFRHVGTFTEQGTKLGRYVDVAWYERAFDEG